jgi:hypothetical protein
MLVEQEDVLPNRLPSTKPQRLLRNFRRQRCPTDSCRSAERYSLPCCTPEASGAR